MSSKLSSKPFFQTNKNPESPSYKAFRISNLAETEGFDRQLRLESCCLTPCKHPLAAVTHTHEASPGCFSSASAPLSGSNPPHKFIYNKNSTDYCRCCSCYGGDGGIRTLEPRRANAFRVRLVMTTSIRLHVHGLLYIKRLQISTLRCQKPFEASSLTMST